MSALEKALRQIDAEQQEAPWLSNPYAMEPPVPPRQDRFWRWLAMLAMLLMMAMLVMAWFWLGDDSHSLRKLSAAAGSQAPVPAASAPVPAASASVPVAQPVPAASVPVTATPSPTGPAAGWNDAGEQLWRSGQHSEAARTWLEALRQLPPDTAVLQLAKLQLYPQAKALKQAWGSQYPVLVLAGPALVNRKRWTVLAVPTAAQLQQAQLQLSVAQHELLPVQTVSQWLSQHMGDSQVSPAITSAPPLPVVPALTVPLPASLPAPASGVAQPGKGGRLATAPAAAPAPGASAPLPATASARAPAGEPAADTAPAGGSPEAAAQRPSGPPEGELQRVSPEKVAGNAAASAVAKSIEVDYQAVEKLLARGESQPALDAALKLEKSIGENWRTRFLAGVAQLGLGRLEEATTALTRAQQLNPAHLLSAVYLTVALQERGEHAKAIQVVQRALEKNPGSPELWLNLGHSSQATGQSAQARKAYQQFMALSGSRQDLAAQRAWVQAWLQKDN